MMLPYGLILLLVHLTDYPHATPNVLSVFWYPKYSSVAYVLFELGLPSFNTLICNSKVSFAHRVSVCDNAVYSVFYHLPVIAGCVVVTH